MGVVIALETEGTYWIEILLDGDLKLRYPLKAVTVQNKSGQGTQTA